MDLKDTLGLKYIFQKYLDQKDTTKMVWSLCGLQHYWHGRSNIISKRFIVTQMTPRQTLAG